MRLVIIFLGSVPANEDDAAKTYADAATSTTEVFISSSDTIPKCGNAFF